MKSCLCDAKFVCLFLLDEWESSGDSSLNQDDQAAVGFNFMLVEGRSRWSIPEVSIYFWHSWFTLVYYKVIE